MFKKCQILSIIYALIKLTAIVYLVGLQTASNAAKERRDTQQSNTSRDRRTSCVRWRRSMFSLILNLQISKTIIPSDQPQITTRTELQITVGQRTMSKIARVRRNPTYGQI